MAKIISKPKRYKRRFYGVSDMLASKYTAPKEPLQPVTNWYKIGRFLLENVILPLIFRDRR